MFNMRQVGLVLVTSTLALAVGVPARAASFTNGNFETSDFTGWKTVGNTDIVSQFYPQPPNGATYEAQITSYDPPTGSNPGGSAYTLDISPSVLETQLGLPTGIFASQSKNNVLSGSGISQAVNLNAGDTVSFAYDFLTTEPVGTANGATYDDFAFFQASSGTNYTSPLNILASVTTSSFNNTVDAPDFTYDTSFKNYSFTAPTSGSYNISVGVTNVGTGSTGGSGDTFSSAILVSNFQVTQGTKAVPEPSVTNGILSVLAIGAVFLYRRCRQMKQE